MASNTINLNTYRAKLLSNTYGANNSPIYFNDGVPTILTTIGGQYEPVWVNNGVITAMTAGTTAQFYRGDKSWSNTLTGSLVVSIAKGTENHFVARASGYTDSKNLDVKLMVGAGKINHGVYSMGYSTDGNAFTSDAKWLIYRNNAGTIIVNGNCTGNAGSATKLETARTIWGQSFNGTANITGQLDITNADIIISDSSTTTRQIRWTVGTNDLARVAAGATAANSGWMEIATADDGNEPIYVKQYTGVFSTLKRTLTLLDASGNTTIPGKLYIDQPASLRSNGIIGSYDYTKAAAIWCMGASYQIAADGSGLGTLYGAAYAYQSQTCIGSKTLAGGHQFVWAQNGVPYVALGNHVWSTLSPTSWLGGQKDNNAAYNIADYSNKDSYNPWMRATNTWSSGEESAKVGRWFSFGTLGTSFYWMGSTTTRTVNSYDYGMTYNISNGTLTATNFSGNLTGNVTGNCSGSSASCTGNAATATKATQDSSGNTITSYYCTLSTAQTISGAKTFTGNLNIGASAAGGYLNGSATNGGRNSILIGDDVWLGDCNVGGIMAMQAKASSTTTCGIYCYNGAGTQIGQLYFNGTNLVCNKTISANLSGTVTGDGSGSSGGGTGNAATATALANTASDVSATAVTGALQAFWNANKTTLVRNKLISFTSSHSGRALHMGYFINGYDSNPYGGFFTAFYGTPYYSYASNGSFGCSELVRNNGGSYGISVTGSSGSCTGNAATASSVAWANVSGRPTIDKTTVIYQISRGANFDPIQSGYFAGMSTSTGITGDWWHILSMDWSGNDANSWISQLALPTQDRTGVYYRSRHNSTTYAWKKLWTSGESITNAVWNDYAECRIADTQESGRVLMEVGDDTLTPTNERMSHFAGISSDTWGFLQGETDVAKTPLAVAGRTLVYTYRDRNEYKPGDCVCAAPNGTVDIMTREEVIQYPDRIVGTVSCVPNYEEWGGSDTNIEDRPPIKVNGRIWIKVH